MRKKNYVLLSFIPLLAACSSYTGVISQQYDGERIETDTAVLAAYEEKYEIVGDEKEVLGEALPEFFYREPLDFGDDEDYMHPLTEEPLTVGVDLPEGRYTIVKSEEMGTGYFTVMDTDDTKVFEQLLDFTQNTLELNLYDGMKITANEGYSPRLFIFGKSVAPFDPSAMFADTSRPEVEGQKHFGNGVYHVGKHIEPGEYNLEVGLNYMATGVNYVYVLQTDGSFNVFELTGDYREWVDSSITLSLEEGQTLFIASKSTTVLTPVE